MALVRSTTRGLYASRLALRGQWSRLASCLMPPVLCLVITLNGVPVDWLSQTEAEAAAGESTDEDQGPTVELFGRLRRCQPVDAELPHGSVLPLALAVVHFPARVLNRDGGWPALPLSRNGCGAVLRC